MGDAEGPGGAGAREPYVPSDSVWGTFWSALGDSALNLAERLPLVNHLVDGEGARQRLLDRGVSASTLATSEGLFDVSTELLATAATGGTGKLAKGATKIYNLANKGEAAIDGVQAAAQGDARGAVLAAASFLPARKGKNPVSKTLGAVDPDDAAKLSGPVRKAASSDQTLFRQGTSNESAARLGRKAAEAEAKIGIHGVSVSTTESGIASSAAARAKVEQHFKVHDTPTNADPGHKTVELPKPVTNAVSKLFNSLFGR